MASQHHVRDVHASPKKRHTDEGLRYRKEKKKKKSKKHSMAPEVLETFISIPEKKQD